MQLPFTPVRPARRAASGNRGRPPERPWLWGTLLLSSITIVFLTFGLWELVEHRFFRDLDYVTLHYLYITRGITSSLLLAVWAAWFVLRHRRRSEEELRRSYERYRGLLEASPGAVALYDRDRRVIEWNAAAERLYGFSKADVMDNLLPTVPVAKETELFEMLRKVEAGQLVLDVETQRQGKNGVPFDVQLSLLAYREPGAHYFLEVSSDIREKVRLRQTLLEVEKLTSMGKMAAGTAHHLNTPLAAMLLRVQMIQERPEAARFAQDIANLEAGIRACQNFVRRLLDFSRRAPVQKQPEHAVRIVESVVSFFEPTLKAKRARTVLRLTEANGEMVLADRSQLEALFSILLSNAVDAIEPGGTISVGSRKAAEAIEFQVKDSGCGISATDQERIFEPFFTTKGSGRGTGLGLPIARNIVTEHGGSIELKSTVGEGTTVTLRLPRCSPG